MRPDIRQTPEHLRTLQVLTVSATRENEVQQLAITFTGNTTDGGSKMFVDATTNAFVFLTFDSGSMNWACTDASATTSNVSNALPSVRMPYIRQRRDGVVRLNSTGLLLVVMARRHPVEVAFKWRESYPS